MPGGRAFARLGLRFSVSGSRLPPLPAPTGVSPGGLRVVHLELGDAFLDLLGWLRVEQVDQRPDRLDPDPRLLEVLLVLLRDPPRGEVDQADDALEQDVLDPELAQLVLEPRPQLLLARLASARRPPPAGSVPSSSALTGSI